MAEPYAEDTARVRKVNALINCILKSWWWCFFGLCRKILLEIERLYWLFGYDGNG